MNIEYQIQPKKDYLLIKVTGGFKYIEGQETFIKNIFEFGAKHSLTNILIDVRSLQGELSVLDRFMFSEIMSRQHLKFILTNKNKPFRIAFVGSHPIIDTRKFGAIVAANRGLNILSTTDINKAFEWLRFISDN
jgi:hypothetical protein